MFNMTKAEKENWLSSGKVANMLGVTTSTLGNWDRRGILVPERRLEKGHRRYSVAQIKKFMSKGVAR